MAEGDAIAESEVVVRAAMYPSWDVSLRRGTPSLFTSTEVSVSRLSILDMSKIVAIFKTDFDERLSTDGQSRRVQAVGRARVGDIVQQAETLTNKDFLPNVVLTVVEDPICNEPLATDNPAHALICGWERQRPVQPRSIPRSVAKRLLDLFGWESL